METIIDIVKLSKFFPSSKRPALNKVTVSIPKNKFTSIVGYSGAGKSVLLRIILGLEKLSKGDVKVFDQSLSQVSRDDLDLFRRNLGVVFQNSALFDHFSVLDNVCFPLLEFRSKEMSYKQMVAQAKSVLISSGLAPEDFNKMPLELSGGMKRRVAVARALILNPKVLVYDEPTTGLDPILTDKIDKLIMETHHATGISTILVTHDLVSALKYSDFIIMLSQGELLESGNKEDFLQSSNEQVQNFIKKGLGRYEEILK